MTTLASTSSRLALMASVLVCVLAASARGEVPSLDAYAGQALVLGKHHRPNTGNRAGARNDREASSGASSSSTSRSSGQAGSQSPGSPESGAARPTSGKNASGAGSAQTGSGSRSSGNPSSGAGGMNGEAGSSQPALPATSSSAFSGLDVLLLIAGLVCLAGIGALLRLARRPS